MLIITYAVIIYFIIGLIYALKINAKPIEQKPLWTSTRYGYCRSRNAVSAADESA